MEPTTHDERNLRQLLVQLENAKALYLDNAVLIGLLEQRIRTIKAQLGELERASRRNRGTPVPGKPAGARPDRTTRE